MPPHSTVVQQHSEVLHTNQRHPFLTLEKGFVPVSQLTLGMHVLDADGTVGTVTGWQGVAGTQVMYHLEVAQDHTYTVGAGEWVVHNCGLAEAGKVPSKGGFIEAGRAFQKHADRVGGELWGKVQGTPAEINAKGQSIVETIVNSGDTQWSTRYHARFGDILEGYLPDGRGARWSLNPVVKFIGFISR